MLDGAISAALADEESSAEPPDYRREARCHSEIVTLSMTTGSSGLS